MATIGDEQHKRAIILRLKRVEGQLRAIESMIETESDCEHVAQQLAASRKALDKAFFSVLACAIQSQPGAGTSAEARLQHAAELLAKFG